MNICLIYQDQYPWDVRIEKIARTLAEEGYEIHILCKNRDGLQIYEHLENNIFIHRLQKGLGKITRLITNYPAFFSPFWIIKLYKLVKKNHIKLIIVRDLPLGPTAYIVGKITNIPVIMDMAENYPELIKSSWIFRGPKIYEYIIKNPYMLKKMENWLLPKLGGIIVVSRASKERVEILLKNKKKSIYVVRNTPVIDEHNIIDQYTAGKEIDNNNILKLLYTGYVEAHRGLEVVLKAIKIVLKENNNIEFNIVGKGKYVGEIKKLAATLNIEKNVLLAGWVDSKYIPSIISSSDICIVPHFVTEHTNTTIPNKIFDYMLQKKPVIVTNCKTLIEIIEGYGCGYVYNDKNPEELAHLIIKLQDQGLRKKLGESGHKAVMESYNWKIDRDILLDSVEKTIYDK